MLYWGNQAFDIDRLVAKLESVDKEAVCKAANSLKLQAIYFYGRSRMTKVTLKKNTILL